MGELDELKKNSAERRRTKRLNYRIVTYSIEIALGTSGKEKVKDLQEQDQALKTRSLKPLN